MTNTEIGSFVADYMASDMEMQDTERDQQQNWIFGHMVTLIHRLLDRDEAAEGRRAPIAPDEQEVPKRHNCPKCGWDQWDGPLYQTRKHYSSYPEGMERASLTEALQFQCTRCKWLEYDPIAKPLPASPTPSHGAP